MRRIISRIVLGIGLGLADQKPGALLGKFMPGVTALPPARRFGLLFMTGLAGNPIIHI